MTQLTAMRSLAHISDLHFGRHDDAVVGALLADLHALAPSLIVISGDLTQRARASEFRAAARFLEALPAPYVVVPGNHDVPLYNLVERFLRPLSRYRRLLHDELCPMFVDAELAVLGINTARSWAIAGGRVSYEQIDFIRERFATVPAMHFKVLVTHHPFIPSPHRDKLALVGRAPLALAALEESGVQLLLAGHLHHWFHGDIAAHYPAIQRSILVFQAGTSTSTRLRGEDNSYNFITVDMPQVEAKTRVFDGQRFVDASVARYGLTHGRWQLAAG